MIDRLADILVRYSTAVRPGEVVSLLGAPETEPLLRELYCSVLQAGGHPFVLMRSEAFDDLLARHGNADQLAFVDPLAAREVEVADVAIHVLSASPGPSRGSAGRRSLLHRFLERVGRRELRWTATIAPMAGEERSSWNNQLAQAMFLNQPDPIRVWQEQRRRQSRLIAVLEQTREVWFGSPWDTDLRIRVAGCRWNNGDGHENFPDGEVWTSPLRDSVEGEAYFDSPFCLGGETVTGARLTFRAGRMVRASATSGEAALKELLAPQSEARQVCEVALGCNYAITESMGHPLLDEKIGGTFHIALGAANRAGIHLDLIADLRRAGRIEADGRPISINGRFVDPDWPGDHSP